MKITQLLNMERSKVKSWIKPKLEIYKRFPQKGGSNVILRTIKLYSSVINEFEVDLVLACRDILRYFLIVLIIYCLFSTVKVHS